MPSFIIIMLLTIAIFIFYRLKAVRLRTSYKKQWTIAKAHIALGLFVAAFALNRLLISISTVIIIVCVLLIAYGLFIAYHNFKRYRLLLPYVVEEKKRSLNDGQ